MPPHAAPRPHHQEPRTHPAATGGSRGPSGQPRGLRGAPACASPPKNSTAVTVLPTVNQSRICSAVSARSMMAAARPRTAVPSGSFTALGLALPTPRDRAPRPGGGAEGRRPPCWGGRPPCWGGSGRSGVGPGVGSRLRFPGRNALLSRSQHEARSLPGHSTKHGPLAVPGCATPSLPQGSSPQARSRFIPPRRVAACRCRPLPGGPASSTRAWRNGWELGSAPPQLQGALPGRGRPCRAGASPSRRPPQRHRRLSPLRDLRRPPRSPPALRVGAAGRTSGGGGWGQPPGGAG